MELYLHASSWRGAEISIGKTILFFSQKNWAGGCGGIYLAQDEVQWRALLNVIMIVASGSVKVGAFL
jgi:hypothetical protein